MLARMAIFALVHGSMHGGWCWRELVALLERRGHRVVAPDLPCEDVAAGLADYADTVEASLASIPGGTDAGHDALVLVGHSLGSRTIPVVAARRPAAQMIFLCSVPTGTGAVDASAFMGMVSEEYAAARFLERGDGARRIDEEAARRLFFGACPHDTAASASSRLRWQGPRPMAEASPLARWPENPLDIILTREDRAVHLDWATAEARRWLSGRVPIVLPGDHSPFLSNPALLAETLIALGTRQRPAPADYTGDPQS